MRDFLILLAGIAFAAVILLTPLRGYIMDGLGWCWDHSVARLLSWLYGVRRP